MNNTYLGVLMAAREKFESDCIAILEFLAFNEYSGLDDMAEETGVSTSELRRYLLPETPEKRKRGEILRYRKTNRRMYYKIIENCQFNDDGTVTINTSKHGYLRHYALKYDYEIIDVEEYPHISVHKLSRSQRDNDIDELVEHGRPVERRSVTGPQAPKNNSWSPGLT